MTHVLSKEWPSLFSLSICGASIPLFTKSNQGFKDVHGDSIDLDQVEEGSVVRGGNAPEFT